MFTMSGKVSHILLESRLLMSPSRMIPAPGNWAIKEEKLYMRYSKRTSSNFDQGSMCGDGGASFLKPLGNLINCSTGTFYSKRSKHRQTTGMHRSKYHFPRVTSRINRMRSNGQEIKGAINLFFFFKPGKVRLGEH